MKWTVKYYETANSTTPVFDFIESLPTKLRTKALSDLALLEELGNVIKLPYSKFIRDGLFELRISQSNNEARIFYFFFVKNTIILTNGFIKKTQKTPKSEIDKALKYKSDYERRFTK